MKLSKTVRSILLILAIALLSIFIVGVALKVYWNVTAPKTPKVNLSYVLKPSKTSLKVGEKVSVPVYLSGDNIDKATAFDVKFTYDTKSLKLTGVTPGTFYNKYIKVKWDQKNAWFALAITPSASVKTANPDSPLITLEFTAIVKSTSAGVSTGNSTVYIAKTGGFHPQSGKTAFGIQ